MSIKFKRIFTHNLNYKKLFLQLSYNLKRLCSIALVVGRRIYAVTGLDLSETQKFLYKKLTNERKEKKKREILITKHINEQNKISKKSTDSIRIEFLTNPVDFIKKK